MISLASWIHLVATPTSGALSASQKHKEVMHVMTPRRAPLPTDSVEGGSSLRFTETRDDGVPGRSVTFTWENVRPLGYAELAAAKLHQKLTIPLELHGSKIAERASFTRSADGSRTQNVSAVPFSRNPTGCGQAARSIQATSPRVRKTIAPRSAPVASR
jgi:hypothetical protein